MLKSLLPFFRRMARTDQQVATPTCTAPSAASSQGATIMPARSHAAAIPAGTGMPPQVNPAPRPLARELPPATPFPIDALGPILASAANGINQLIQTPNAIGGQSVLAAAALAVQGHANVRMPYTALRPVSCMMLTVGVSGERKSAVDDLAIKAIRNREQELSDTYKRDKHRFDAELKNRQSDEGECPLPPLNGTLMMQEPTYEGIVRQFAEGQPSQGLFTAEGGRFLGGSAMTKDNRLKTAAGLSELWDGTPITRVRSSEPASQLRGRRLSAHLMCQPGVASTLLSDPEMRDQGLLSRLLVTAPESAIGSRLYRPPTPADIQAIDEFTCCISKILAQPLPLRPGTGNELEPRALLISPAAEATWIVFYNEVETAQKLGGQFHAIRGFASKAAEHAARIAAVLALVGDITTPEVRQTEMEAAIELTRHYLAEANRLFGLPPLSPDLELAAALLAWLQSKWTEDLVSLVDIYQYGPQQIRDKRTASRAVDALVDHAWLVPIQGKHNVRGKPRKDVWEIWRSN